MVQTVVDDRIPMSPALQASLMRARDYASQQSHTQVHLEHLLLALTEDDDAALVLQSCRIDLERLRHDVSGHIGSQIERLPGGGTSDPGISPGLTQILKYATLAAKQGRRPRIDGAIVLAAIVGDERSMAAAFLKAQGLTFEEAIRALQQVGTPPGRRAAPPSSPPDAGPHRAPPALEEAETRAGSGPPHAHGPTTAVARTARTLIDTEDLLAAARARVVSRGVLPRMGDTSGSDSDDHPKLETPVVEQPVLPDQQAQTSAPVVEPTPAPVEPAAVAPERLTTPPDAEPTPAPPPRAGAQPPPLPWAPPPLPSMPRPPRAQDAAAGPRPLPTPPAPPVAPPPLPPTDIHPAARPEPAHERPTPSPPRMGPPTPARAAPYTPGQGPGSPPPGYPQRPPEPGPPQRPPGFEGGPRGDFGRALLLDAKDVTHSIPTRLRVGIVRSVEVRIARPMMAEGGGGPRPAPRADGVLVRTMSVRLRSARDALTIVALSPETHWDKPGAAHRPGSDADVWRFLVTPSKSGSTDIVLAVTVLAMGVDGQLVERALPEQIIPVDVTPNIARRMRRVGQLLLTSLVSIALLKTAEELLQFDSIELLRRLTGF